MNKEKIEKLKRELETFREVIVLNTGMMNFLLEIKDRSEEKSKLLTKIRNLVVKCQTIVETETKEMKELCGQQ